ncbi:chorismate--pyruvate lyase family protein [Pelagibaculum spongiae]|uniref:chorismate--pyruvate lyase family protein n=1 Tax=Pelagibaculum spongiae TaxID=2080658 RepID=UPI0019D4C8E5|nr:chorismate lyase [Pelagibaculum spongiae]
MTLNCPSLHLGHSPADWRTAGCWSQQQLPAPLRSWLLDKGSLTRRLQAYSACGFKVILLSQAWQGILQDERQILDIPPRKRAMVREVLLCDGEKPLVYARSIIPDATFRGPGRFLTRLGSRPLGEKLFSDHSVIRGPLSVTRCDSRHKQFWQACSAAPIDLWPSELWGRRSVFKLNNQPLLVSEFFLPELLKNQA